LAQRKALIRYYFGAEPKSFEDIARDWGQLQFALQFDNKLKIDIIKKG